jgi:hypothetical protein
VETLIAQIEGRELKDPRQATLTCPLVPRNSIA